MNEREKKIIKKLGKYPQNIMFFLITLLICFGIIFLVKSNNVEEYLKHITTISVHKQQNFKVSLENTVYVGSKHSAIDTKEFSGDCIVNILPPSYQIKVLGLNLNAENLEIKNLGRDVELIEIQQDKNYPTTGKFNIKTGEADISTGINIKMKVDDTIEQISLVMPLIGKINGNNSSFTLSGKATIPPNKLMIPIPLEISINAKKI